MTIIIAIIAIFANYISHYRYFWEQESGLKHRRCLVAVTAPPVWPDPESSIRGESFSPLYKSVPIATKNDSKLYELLALVDAIRGGQTREREMAKKELKKRLAAYE